MTSLIEYQEPLSDALGALDKELKDVLSIYAINKDYDIVGALVQKACAFAITQVARVGYGQNAKGNFESFAALSVRRKIEAHQTSIINELQKGAITWGQ